MNYLAVGVIFGVVLASPCAHAAADYKDGWDSSQFYEQVALCRQAVVYPAAKSYTEKGIAAGTAPDKLRTETIAMLPMFDATANAACFCAVNELAKARPFSDYAGLIDTTARVNVLNEYMRRQPCAGKVAEAVKALQKDGAWKTLKLQ